ncbi:MAG: T9SS type A sorting domain-containing protein [Kordia sp.]|uniref:T9SS type A sorting domain-containing protein n=1 Tax=Kordia sp. TaxID=1965332 RepID=UPI00385E1A3A
MKKFTPKLLVIFLLLFISKAKAQQNDFKIGMFGVSTMHNTNAGVTVDRAPLTAPTLLGNNTSPLNVLHQDGFNIGHGYKPDNWTATKVYQESLLTLISNFEDMQFFVHAREWYIPGTINDDDHTIDDLNMYDNYGMNINDIIHARPNYDDLVSQVYNTSMYKDLVWGYQVTEESTSLHPRNGKQQDTGVELVDCDIPVEHVQEALNHFSNIVHPEHKLVLWEAAHGQGINESTNLNWPINNPQDYIKLNNVDVFFEGSYMSLTGDWINQKYSHIYQNRNHYLGSLKSIDYAYEHVEEVHDVILMDRNQGEFVDDINYINTTHSNPAIKNANWMWFKTYSSIIHGVKGIWFWDLGQAYERCEKSELLMNNGHYSNDDIIVKAKEYDEWLNRIGNYDDITWSCTSEEIIKYTPNGSTEIKEIKVRYLYERAARKLFKGLDVRYNEDYFPKLYKDYTKHLARELRYLVDENLISTDPNSILYSKTDHADTNCIVPPAESYLLSNLPAEKRTENYGLRYTIRTNGDDVIMIVTNPLNMTVSTTLDFSNVANPIIQNATGVDILFEPHEYFISDEYTFYGPSLDVNSLIYKTNRNSDIDLNSSTVGKQYFKNFINDKSLDLIFGPLDTHILKFKSTAPIINSDGWVKEWTNHGSGKIDGWDVNDSHKFYVGDFDGDQVEELLCVQTKNNENWITMVNYENGDWHWKWSNYGDATHMLAPYRTNFLVGDFDGDGKDELLGNPEIGWITMFDFENGAWEWKWSDNGNHSMTLYKENLIVGDFDGDDRDEIFGSPENGWSTMFKFENNDFQWAWTTGGANHGIRPYRNLVAGDFDNDGKDEILGLDSWATMFHYENNDFQWGWSTYGASTFSGWGYPLDGTDKVLIGDIDTNDTKDEILFIQQGLNAYWATSMDLKNDGSNWNWNWSANPNYSIPYIYDWQISGNNKEKYLLIKAEANAPKQLLAMRPYGCDLDNSNFLVSMYKPVGEKINSGRKKSNLELDAKLETTIHPNPFVDNINIRFKEPQTGKIEILSMQGYVFRQKEFTNENQVNFNLKELRSGIYFVKFYIEGEAHTRQIVKY